MSRTRRGRVADEVCVRDFSRRAQGHRTRRAGRETASNRCRLVAFEPEKGPVLRRHRPSWTQAPFYALLSAKFLLVFLMVTGVLGDADQRQFCVLKRSWCTASSARRVGGALLP